MEQPKDPLDSLLDRWGKATPEHEDLAPEIWRRIAATETSEEKPNLAISIRNLFSQRSLNLAFTAVVLLLGLFLMEIYSSHRQAERNQQIVLSYLHLIDPLLETGHDATTSPSNNLDAMLSWMKDDLQLSTEQLARIKSVHEQLRPRLLNLAGEVEKMQRTLDAFEKERQSAGQVDFIEFAHFVEQRRHLDRECSGSTRHLIDEAANVMTPSQRQQYLQLLDPALKATGGGSL